MDIDETAAEDGYATAEENAEEEADFPDVALDELLEDFDEMTLGAGEVEAEE